MFQITRKDERRLDLEFSGKFDAEDMKRALDELTEAAEGIENGRMLYKIGDFDLPTLGAIGIELTRIPQVFRFIRRFDRMAVISAKQWVRKASRVEGGLIPGMEVRTFDADQEQEAEAWLTREEPEAK